jgi:hypothetical protein
MKRKGVFWFIVLEASVHDQPSLLFLVSGGAEGNTSLQECVAEQTNNNNKVHLITGTQKRGRDQAFTIPFKEWKIF